MQGWDDKAYAIFFIIYYSVNRYLIALLYLLTVLTILYYILIFKLLGHLYFVNHFKGNNVLLVYFLPNKPDASEPLLCYRYLWTGQVHKRYSK